MLDKKECKGFLEGLLKYLKEDGRRNNYNEANYEWIFDEYDVDKKGTMAKWEMAELIKDTFKDPASDANAMGGAAGSGGKGKRPVDKLKLVIKYAKFNKDNDAGLFGGKQDPCIKFEFAGKAFKTTTKDGAGKEATFDEEFILEDIAAAMKSGATLKFNAYDVDTLSDDLIGATEPVKFPEFTFKPKIVVPKMLPLVDKSGKDMGYLNITTQYFSAADGVGLEASSASGANAAAKAVPDQIKLTIIDGTFLKDLDTFGKMDPFV